MKNYLYEDEESRMKKSGGVAVAKKNRKCKTFGKKKRKIANKYGSYGSKTVKYCKKYK